MSAIQRPHTITVSDLAGFTASALVASSGGKRLTFECNIATGAIFYRVFFKGNNRLFEVRSSGAKGPLKRAIEHYNSIDEREKA